MTDHQSKPHDFFRPDLELSDHIISEKALAKDLTRILRTNCIVIDVGANRGQFALEMLKIVPNATIYSIEPLENAFKDLQLISSNLNQIHSFNYAVSINSGYTDFNVTESDVGSSILEPIPNQPSKWLTLINKVSVKTIRLDDFIKSNIMSNDYQQIDLLKSDTQGTDLDVLLSAGDFLNPRNIKSVLVEINFVTFYKAQQKFQDIITLLEDSGYRLAWIYPHRDHNEWLWWADALFIER